MLWRLSVLVEALFGLNFARSWLVTVILAAFLALRLLNRSIDVDYIVFNARLWFAPTQRPRRQLSTLVNISAFALSLLNWVFLR